jgi:hypothetical protein
MGGSSEYTVHLLLEWLHHRTTTVRTLSDDYDPENEAATDRRVAAFFDRSALWQLWVVADILAIPALQNSALSQLNSVVDKFGLDTIYSVPYVYGNTSKGSKLRDYLLGAVTLLTPTEVFEDGYYHNWYPREFLLEIGHFFFKTRALLVDPQFDLGDLARHHFVPVGV